MPGMNQKGPMNEGAMTGQGRGICVRESSPRGNNRGSGPRCGRGRGKRLRAAQMAPPAEMENKGLLNRILQLESQLAELKAQLDDPLEENLGPSL